MAVAGIVAAILLVPLLVLLQVNRNALTNPTSGADLGAAGSVVRTPSDDQKDPMDHPPHGITSDGAANAWARESHYLTTENSTRWLQLDDGGVKDTQAVDTPRPHAIRVVAVGDSFTYGVGQTDPRMAWPKLLERELNARTAPGTFTVERLARPGTSIYTQAQWLHNHRELLQQSDMVVLGVVENDATPGPNDGTPCAPSQDPTQDPCPPQTVENHPLYQACLSGERTEPIASIAANLAPGAAEKLLDSDCSVARFSSALNLPSANHASYNLPASPLGPAFAHAVERILTAAGTTPVYAAPLDMWRGRERHLKWPGMAGPNPYVGPVTAQDITRAYAHYGIPAIPMPNTMNILTGAWNPHIEVHPGDAHPGPMLTLAYSQDITDYIIQAIPKERIQRAESEAPAEPEIPRPLIVAHLPTAATVTQGAGTATINVPSRTSDGPYTSVGPFAIAGKELPPQLAPCMTLGRPHLRVDLDPLKPGAHTLTLALQTGPELDVFTVEYTEKNEQVVRSAGILRPQGVLTIKPTAAAPITGVMLAPRERHGCPLGAPIELPPMAVIATLEN